MRFGLRNDIGIGDCGSMGIGAVPKFWTIAILQPISDVAGFDSVAIPPLANQSQGLKDSMYVFNFSVIS